MCWRNALIRFCCTTVFLVDYHPDQWSQKRLLEKVTISMHCNLRSEDTRRLTVVLAFNYETHIASSCQILTKVDSQRLSYQSLPLTIAPRGAGAPSFPPCPFTSLSFAPFSLFPFLSGFNYFLLLSIPFLSTRTVPLRFQAGGRRMRPNLGLVCSFYFVLSVLCS